MEYSEAGLLNQRNGSLMRLKLFYTLVLSFIFITLLSAQKATLQGQITDKSTGEPLVSVSVKVGTTGTVTDFDGRFSLSANPGPTLLEISYVGYSTQEFELDLSAGEVFDLEVLLEESPTLLETATVTSGKYEKSLGEVTVSLEVVRPEFIKSINTTSVDEVLDRIPGVTIIDGQANIRGGSGFSYGAGSRVLLLVDDVPFFQADAGLTNWNDVPVENISQIEVVKGAASALYGSSALNGIINIRTDYATSQPEFNAAIFHQVFMLPADRDKQWWDRTPYTTGASLAYKRRFGRLDVVMSAFVLDRESYNERTLEDYKRLSGGLRYRISEKVTLGLNWNVNAGENQDFFFWANGATGNYRGFRTSFNRSERLRYYLDPFLIIYDPLGNRHKFLGRYLSVDNVVTNDQSNSSQMYYGEYQFQRQFTGLELVTTAGIVYQATSVSAPLYGDTTYSSQNLAGYLQMDKKFFDRLNVSVGFRFEANQLNNPGYVYFNGLMNDTVPPSEDYESKPVFRVGANYQAGQATFFRASWGQGYRYPTIAEKYILTTFGGVPISPNPDLESETGWSTELAVKQGYRLGQFEGFLDLAAFWTEYQNMMEFNFINLFPTGFRSENVGNTVIKGMEFTVAGRGTILGLQTNLMGGYTYIDPKFEVFDTTAVAEGQQPTEGQKNAINSSVNYNVLKYRTRHSYKFDIESVYKKWSLGLTLLGASHMESVDKIFEVLIVPGLKDYRAENNRGYRAFNVRLAFEPKPKHRFSLLVNNLFNAEYAIRPGLLDAPRNVTLRLDYGF